MIPILLYCEGVTDYEPIRILMEKAAPVNEFSITRKTRSELLAETKVLSNRRGIHKSISDIDRLFMVAKKSKCRHIAYHQDADGRYRDVYSSICERFSEKLSQGYHCLAIVSKEMIESWLLADSNAFAPPIKQTDLPKKPEEIWGAKDDPDSDRPKYYLERVLKKSGQEANRDTYAAIAQKTNLDVLLTRCPKSFKQFHDDMQSFLPVETRA